MPPPQAQDVNLEVSGFEAAPDGLSLATSWRFSCILALPWRPRLAASGGTTHVFDPATGLVVRHIERWDVEPARVARQLLRPAAPLPTTSAEVLMHAVSDGDAGGARARLACSPAACRTRSASPPLTADGVPLFLFLTPASPPPLLPLRRLARPLAGGGCGLCCRSCRGIGDGGGGRRRGGSGGGAGAVRRPPRRRACHRGLQEDQPLALICQILAPTYIDQNMFAKQTPS